MHVHSLLFLLYIYIGNVHGAAIARQSASASASRLPFAPHILPLTSTPITPNSPINRRPRPYNRTPVPIPRPTLPFDLDSNATEDSRQDGDETVAETETVQHDLYTYSGRVYMTDISVGTPPVVYTVVVDTGSSDTWLASLSFQCESQTTHTNISLQYCGFGTLYNPAESASYSTLAAQGVAEAAFAVNYTDGEFLGGVLGVEDIGIGGGGGGGIEGGADESLKVRQTIGIVSQGWWDGDGVSSGLMGLAYPAMVSGYSELGYTSVMFSLFNQTPSLSAIFSLAISRPDATGSTNSGGLLAIGGIPDVEYDGDFVTVPIQPISGDVYAFYAVEVQGFNVSAAGNGGDEDEDGDGDGGSSDVEKTKRGERKLGGYGDVGEGLDDVSDDVEGNTFNNNSRPRPKGRGRERSALTSRKEIKTTAIGTANGMAPISSSSSSSPSPSTSTPRTTEQSLASLAVTGIIDSGSTHMYLPNSVFSPPATYTPTTGLYTAPCTATPPSLGITIAGTTFWVDGRDLLSRENQYSFADSFAGDRDSLTNISGLEGVKDAGGDIVGDGEGGEGGNGGDGGKDGEGGGRQTGRSRLCVVQIQRQGAGDTVLGDAFLRGVVAVFDLADNQMQFAARSRY
ncbi:acid protease [Lophiostoma macrostomum CBS 122681]|uniref:Acid protease n=1 Tax=Lophiostoma macrostomum CBS 122681 TaxID=1314788 RepID=A0A6A6SHP7_9PLEO|nr:acid protease [Lophiostoma macrostomum CBS 122681]